MKKHYLIITLLFGMMPALKANAESYVSINGQKKKLASRTDDINPVINAFPPESIISLEFLNVDGCYTLHYENMKHLNRLVIDSEKAIELKEWILECPELMFLIVTNVNAEKIHISNCKLLSMVLLSKCHLSKELSIVQAGSLNMLDLTYCNFASGTSIAVDTTALSKLVFAYNEGLTALPSFIVNAPNLKEIVIEAHGDNSWIDYESLIKKKGIKTISIYIAPLPLERRASLKGLAKEYKVELRPIMKQR
jgi:hypothetical protein